MCILEFQTIVTFKNVVSLLYSELCGRYLIVMVISERDLSSKRFAKSLWTTNVYISWCTVKLLTGLMRTTMSDVHPIN